MTDNTRFLRLTRILNPRSIVFVGGAALEPAIAYTRKLGFSGQCHVINPSRKQLAGIACVRSAAELKPVPDLAFVAVPGAAAIDALRDLASAGVGAAVVNSSGFAETGDDGAGLEAQLGEAAGDMPFLGPNCPGFANLLDGNAAMLDDYGSAEVERGVAVLSNGGAYLSDISYSDRSLPVACIAGLGNQANVSIAELLDVILDDPRISAVNLHFESIRDVARLSECALKAHQKGIPIVALKAGKSQTGQRAAQSHTASLASDAVIASALFHRLGFVEVETPSEALETLKMLCLGAAPKGPRMALATSSGTYAVLGSDFAEKNGLVVPPLTQASSDSLRPLIHDFLSAGNPLDIATAQFWPDERQRPLFDALLQDDFDMAVQIMSFPSPDTWEDESWYRSASQFAAAARDAGLPAIFVSPTHEGLPRAARDMLIEKGVVPLQGYAEGMQAIAQALAWHRHRVNLNADNLLLPHIAPLGKTPVIPLDEFESKALLAGFAVPIPQGRRWGTEADVPADLRYPVVLKICDASIAHKSDVGGVSLNLASEELLRFSRERMRANLAAQNLEADGFLIEESIHGGVAELMIGVRRIENIGYSLTIAIGGIAVELLNDAVTLLLPCDRATIAAAIEKLKLYPTLIGAGNRSVADLDPALGVIESIVGLVMSRGDIVELEINPLILRAEGNGVFAADAVIKIQTQ